MFANWKLGDVFQFLPSNRAEMDSSLYLKGLLQFFPRDTKSMGAISEIAPLDP